MVKHWDEITAMRVHHYMFEVSGSRYCGRDEDLVISFGNRREVGSQTPLWLLCCGGW